MLPIYNTKPYYFDSSKQFYAETIYNCLLRQVAIYHQLHYLNILFCTILYKLFGNFVGQWFLIHWVVINHASMYQGSSMIQSWLVSILSANYWFKCKVFVPEFWRLSLEFVNEEQCKLILDKNKYALPNINDNQDLSLSLFW